VPAGSAEGGQWTGGGGGGGVTGSVSLLGDAEQVALNIDPNVATDVGLADLFQSVADVLVNLLDEEGGAHDGHAIREHVGKSDAQLIRATELSKTKLGDRWYWKDEIGSFSSLEAANKLVNATLSRNRGLLESLIAGKVNGGVATAFFPYVTGYQSYAPKFNSTVQIRDTNGVRIVLVRDTTSKNGFRIKTAYPFYGNEKP
jgi:hypothetical protein